MELIKWLILLRMRVVILIFMSHKLHEKNTMEKKAIEFILREEYIELFKLLKALKVAPSGGIAKIMIDEEEVYLNGKQELRKRAKIRKGDTIVVEGMIIKVV